MKNLKKGAMFGLDARIALAIFGALSVISGAALYSAIQHAKVVAIVTTANELFKAYDQYLLDTGFPIRKVSEINIAYPNQGYELGGVDLFVDSGVVGWNGPYISLEQDSQPTRFVYDGKVALLIRASTEDWGQVSGAGVKCTVQEKCSVWFEYDAGSAEIANAIDLYVDGVADTDKGRIRILSSKYIYFNSGITYTNM